MNCQWAAILNAISILCAAVSLFAAAMVVRIYRQNREERP